MNTKKQWEFAGWLLLCAAIVLVASCSSSKKAACTGAMCGTAANSGSTATGGTGSGASGSGSGGTSTGKGSGGSSSSTGGSSASTGGTTGGSGGTGGTTGHPDEDAGSGTGGSTGGTVTPLPTDGNQLSVCTMAQGECNRGFACHMPAAGGGQGFCSKVCTMDSDCSGLAPSGATYTCPAAGGFGGTTRVCQIACMGTMDTMTCPKDMACFASGFTGGGGPGGGGTATYACAYTASAGMPPGTKTAWESCMTTQECVTGLGCFGGTPAFGMQAARPGHCAQSCMMTSDCTDKPSSGSISPTCVPSGAPTPAMACGLNCAMMTMGCPTGMTCVAGFGGGRGMTAPSYCQSM